MAEDFRIQVEADLDTSAITKQLADSFNISDKSVLKNLNKQLNKKHLRHEARYLYMQYLVARGYSDYWNGNMFVEE